MTDFLERTKRTIQTLLSEGIVMNPRVVAAQAVLESGWGKSELAKKYHNYFGMKAGSLWQGKTVVLETREVVDGKSVFEDAEWRVYDSPEDCFRDYARFIAESDYFKDALDYVHDDEGYLSVLVDESVKYATDPNYKTLVLGLIDELGLHDTFPSRV